MVGSKMVFLVAYVVFVVLTVFMAAAIIDSREATCSITRFESFTPDNTPPWVGTVEVYVEVKAEAPEYAHIQPQGFAISKNATRDLAEEIRTYYLAVGSSGHKCKVNPWLSTITHLRYAISGVVAREAIWLFATFMFTMVCIFFCAPAMHATWGVTKAKKQ